MPHQAGLEPWPKGRKNQRNPFYIPAKLQGTVYFGFTLSRWCEASRYERRFNFRARLFVEIQRLTAQSLTRCPLS